VPPPFDLDPATTETLIKILVGFAFVALSFLSVWWTTRRTRKVLRNSLGRDLRRGEDASLTAWLNLSDDQLESAHIQLKRDPFSAIIEGMFDTNPTRDTDDIIRMRPIVDTTTSTLWTLTRNGAIASCEMVIAPTGVEARVLHNEMVLHTETFPNDHDVLAWAEEERKGHLAKGWR